MIRSLFAPLAMKVSAGIVAVLLVLLAVQTMRVSSLKGDVGDLETELQAERDAATLFAERVRAKAEEIARKASENARRVETRQNEISQEVSRDYQQKLADLRRRYDAIRVRPTGAGGAYPGGGGNEVPGLSSGPGRPDATAAADLFACEANSLQLGALQDWLRAQEKVER